MADNEYWYNYYRQKYYEACAEINSCESRICNLKNQRQKTVNKINQLKTDINNTQTAINAVTVAIQCEGSINEKLTAVSNKTSEASANYSSMVSSSDIQIKSITDVFSDETTKTRSTVSSIMNTLKSRKNNLSTKLANLQSDLNRANNELQSTDSNINNANSDLSYWKQKKTSNYYNMEDYRRRMLQESF